MTMYRTSFEVAQVLERNREHLAGLCANSWQSRTLHALRKCRTAALGGHMDRCDNPDCHKLHLSYNSCRNRHCPKCQGHKREQWIRAREAELLNVPYFHVVFTLPAELNRPCLYRPEQVYRLLFKTAWQVIQGFSSTTSFWGPTREWSPSCIPGDKICPFIRTCTALYREVGYQDRANGNPLGTKGNISSP